MCNRFVLRTDPRKTAAALDAVWHASAPPAPRFNAAPSQAILAVRRTTSAPEGQGHDPLEAVGLRWGLIPSWAKPGKPLPHLANARSETAATRPVFRAALRSRRCLIPADGFIEWEKDGSDRLPWLFEIRGGLFTFAGIWERWQGPAGEAVESCSILTTSANTVVGRFHDRMPVILDEPHRAAWLDPASTPETLTGLLRPLPDEVVTARRIDRRVNSVRNEDPALLRLPSGEQMTLF